MSKNFKIFDCFMYNNEDFILKLRLNILNAKVDYFVIVESNYDHSGKKKKLNFNINKFNKFKKKIIYIIVKNMPLNTKDFYFNKILYHKNHVRDQFQRNQIMRGLKKARNNDLIIISDIDEIPDLNKIDLSSINNCTIFFQRVFSLRLNLELKSDYPWQGSKIIRFKNLTSPQKIRNTIFKRIKPWQFYRYFSNPKYISYGGWHFTSILPLNKIKTKFLSGAHGEINYENLNLKIIKKKFLKKIDIFDNNKKLTKVKIDQTFPSYIMNNKKKFKKYIV